MKDYSKIKALLEEQETFPHDFVFKFIGHNSSRFADAVKQLENRFPGLCHHATRESGSGRHLSKTYRYQAQSADSIIEIYLEIEKLHDILIVL